jgi:uncharacterized membrane protein
MAESKRTRLVALGFAEEMVARTVLEETKAAIARKDIVVSDWALIHKDAEGKVSKMTDKSADPGAVRGGVFGGAAGLVLAVISGPIGAGAVVGGAAVGAVTAALKDSGFKNDDLDAVSRLMARGRSGLLLSIPMESVEQFDEFVAGNVVFASADTRYQVDLTPTRDFDKALEEYRIQEDA